jgi:hypothetical protein
MAHHCHNTAHHTSATIAANGQLGAFLAYFDVNLRPMTTPSDGAFARRRHDNRPDMVWPSAPAGPPVRHRDVGTFWLLRHARPAHAVSDQAFPVGRPGSAGIYGGYTALVYLTPLIGGLLADQYLGSKRAVKFGALIMAAGYFALALGISGAAMGRI